MSQTNEGIKGYEASGALGKNLRVTLDSNGQLALAGAIVRGIGTILTEADTAGDHHSVALFGGPRTQKMVAAGAIEKLEDVYGAASGKIDDAPNGNYVGVALEAASGNNSVIEVLTAGVGGKAGFSGSWSIGSEAADAIIASLQVNDAEGNAIEARVPVTVLVFDDTNGDAFNTDDYTVAAGTDGAVAEAVADKVIHAMTEDDGDLDISFTITGAATSYLWAVLPDGTIVKSAAMTHAA